MLCPGIPKILHDFFTKIILIYIIDEKVYNVF